MPSVAGNALRHSLFGTAVRAAAVFLWACGSAPAAERSSEPAREFARAFVIEIDGVRRSARRPEQPLPPASLTKMMSGLLVLESGRDLAEPVTVSRRAAAATGSRLGLRTGDRLAVADLLTAMLVASSNDACRSLAEWHSGTEAAFVAAMNARARRMGLVRTRFANACGHDAPGHVSTAGELATLARAVMALPEYARRAALREATLHTADRRRTFRISNHNHLVGRAPGVVGVKSGYTARAGKCLVAFALRGPHEVLLVMLDAKDRWWDAHDALDYAFRRAPELVR